MKQLIFLALAALPLCAGTIAVGNASFENNPPGYGNPTGWSLFSSSSSPTFSDNAQTILNNGSVYPSVSGVDGSQFVAVNLDHNAVSSGNPTPVVPPNGSLDGLVSDSVGIFAADTVYSLTVGIGLSQSLDVLDVGLALGTGSPTLADVFPAPGTPSFAYLLVNGSQLSSDALQVETITLNTNSLPSLVGQPINVSLIFHSEDEFGRAAFFDNVSLSSSTADPAPTPEPSVLVLCGLGTLLILSARRRFQTGRNSGPSRNGEPN